MPKHNKWPYKMDKERSPFLEKTTVRPTSSRRGISILYHGSVIFAFGLSLFLNTILLSQQQSSQDLNAVCSDYTAEHQSPISDQIDIVYQSTSFDGMFGKESIYTQPPSNEVERAWGDLGTHLRHTIVPEDHAQRYGLDPGLLKLSPEIGGGYPVLFEFQHHLHCLNLLRQTSWFNFEHYNATQKDGFEDGEKKVQVHIGHCINQLRQVLMCNPDMGLLGQVWVDELQGPYVKFNDTKHKCKNWDAIYETANRLQAPEGMRLSMTLRDGDTHIPRIP